MSGAFPALEPIPFGSPAREVDGGARVAEDLGEMRGIARRPRGDAGIGYAPGADVAIAADGGILGVLACDATIEVRGVATRLIAGEKYYFELHRGRIVDFNGSGGR